MDGLGKPRWSYEGYWNAVLGAHLDARDVVTAYLLDSNAATIDVWLTIAENEAWRTAGGDHPDKPPEWVNHHARAVSELALAADNAEPTGGRP